MKLIALIFPRSLMKSLKLGLVLLFLFIVIGLPITGYLWLYQQGIVITAISGLKLNHDGLYAHKVSTKIMSYHMTFHELSFHHFTEKTQPQITKGYRLFAKRYDLQLPPALKQQLKQQNININTVHFFDTALTAMPSQSLFYAEAKRVTTLIEHNDTQQPPATQIIDRLKLKLNMTPNKVMTGKISTAKLNLFFPQDPNSPSYPLTIYEAQFKIAWEKQQTPVTIAVKQIIPQWQTLHNTLNQQKISDLSLQFNLHQPLATMKVAAKTIKIEQPKYLPALVDHSKINKSVHLGKTIAYLAQLPLQSLHIDALTYGNILIDSKVTFTPPAKPTSQAATTHPQTVINDAHKQIKQAQQQAKELNIATQHHTQARLKIKGKALAPNPYDLHVNIYHLTQTNARIYSSLNHPNGDHLFCDTKIAFHHPLPLYMNCNAHFKNTQSLTQRFGFKRLPNAKINGPLRIYAQQANNNFKKKPVIHNEEIRYHLGIKLPPSFTLELNKYSFNSPLFYNEHNKARSKIASKHISNIEINNDGKINLDVNYHNQQWHIALSDHKQKIELKNTNTKSALAFLLTKFHCFYPNLQCHLNGHLTASIKTLYPTAYSQINTIDLTTKFNATWANHLLSAQLQQTQFKANNATIKKPVALATTQFNQPSLKFEQLVATLEKKNQHITLALSQPKNTQAKLTTALSTRYPLHHSFKYQTGLTININNANLSHKQLSTQSKPSPLLISADYQLESTKITQNQLPFLPPAQANGTLQVQKNKVVLTAQLATMNNESLANIQLQTHLKKHHTTIKFHPTTISFNQNKNLQQYYLPDLKLPLNINAGSITAKATIDITANNTNSNIQIMSNQLSGNYNHLKINQLDSTLHLQITPKNIKTLAPIILKAHQLNIGIPIDKPNLIIEFDQQQHHYLLQRASANILGSQISTHNIKRNQLMNITRPIPITIWGLNLKNIAQFINHQGIEMTGIVDGTLPLSISDGKPKIATGHFHSRYPGGKLRYLDGSTIDNKIKQAGHQSPLKMSTILKNYHYRALAIKLNYAKNGDLKTHAQFKGFNPDFQQGRSVNINLKIEDNLIELLKTLNILNASKIEQNIVDNINKK